MDNKENGYDSDDSDKTITPMTPGFGFGTYVPGAMTNDTASGSSGTSSGWYQNEFLPWIQNQDPKKLAEYGIGLFLLAGKFAKILHN